MTLSEWSKRTGILPTHATTERQAVSVCVSPRDLLVNALWELDDYAVSTRSGSVVWLVPKKKETSA